jgi:hypothetical protein
MVGGHTCQKLKKPVNHQPLGTSEMPLFEDRSAAFIVRVWCESGGESPDTVRAWRGSIEHVSSGQRIFFKELDAVIAFMKPHLTAIGIEEPSRFWERMDELTSQPIATQPTPLAGDPAPVTSRVPKKRQKLH